MNTETKTESAIEKNGVSGGGAIQRKPAPGISSQKRYVGKASGRLPKKYSRGKKSISAIKAFVITASSRLVANGIWTTLFHYRRVVIIPVLMWQSVVSAAISQRALKYYFEQAVIALKIARKYKGQLGQLALGLN